METTKPDMSDRENDSLFLLSLFGKLFLLVGLLVCIWSVSLAIFLHQYSKCIEIIWSFSTNSGTIYNDIVKENCLLQINFIYHWVKMCIVHRHCNDANEWVGKRQKAVKERQRQREYERETESRAGQNREVDANKNKWNNNTS